MVLVALLAFGKAKFLCTQTIYLIRGVITNNKKNSSKFFFLLFNFGKNEKFIKLLKYKKSSKQKLRQAQLKKHTQLI